MNKRASAKRPISLLTGVIIVMLLGIALFAWLSSLFRAQADETSDALATVQAADFITLPELSTVSLHSAFDGQATGVVERARGEGGATFRVLAYLPPIDPSVEAYEAWLIKDGIADVVYMGRLEPRADGSLGLSFTAKPATGISEVEEYRSVIIMRAGKEETPTPGGNKIAKAMFP